MALNLDDKKAIVAEVNETAARRLVLVIADARGVDVTDMNALRAKARAENVQLRVVRNTLAKRAFAETDYACVEECFDRSVIVCFLYGRSRCCSAFIQRLRERKRSI